MQIDDTAVHDLLNGTDSRKKHTIKILNAHTAFVTKLCFMRLGCAVLRATLS